MSTSVEQEHPVKDELGKNIKAEQQKEVSYIVEASQADDKRTKFLAKLNEYNIAFEDGSSKTFKRKPLSSRKNKEIDDLRSTFSSYRFDNNKGDRGDNKKIKVNNEEFDNVSDVLYEAFKRTAKYCLGMTDEEYDSAIWEDDQAYLDQGIYGLRSILAGCLMRAVHGIAYFRQP